MKTKVLIVDDDLSIRNSLKRLITKEGYDVVLADSGESALKKMSKENPEIAYVDLRLPKMNGLATLEKLKEINNDIVVIIFSAYGTYKDVVKAMKLGAFDYIQKPYNNEDIRISLLKASRNLATKRELNQLQYQNKYLKGKFSLVYKSSKMNRIVELAKKVAKSTNTPILLQGETGVGKGVLARLIHYESPCQDKPFLALNCGAIPENLLEAELFGYEKGAFTGAVKSKPGLIELAEGGTLLLDEVGELTKKEQAKLLQVLEERTFFSVGGTTQKTANTRIIAASNRNLVEQAERGNFREDLYYRLCTINIEIPPLRERQEDILPLAMYFLGEFNKALNKKIKGISSKAKKWLLEQKWKGNVRELKNVMERAVLLESNDFILANTLGLNNDAMKLEKSLVIDLNDNSMSLDKIIKVVIENVLVMTNMNQVKAAEILGLPRSTLRYKIKKYKIDYHLNP